MNSILRKAVLITGSIGLYAAPAVFAGDAMIQVGEDAVIRTDLVDVEGRSVEARFVKFTREAGSETAQVEQLDPRADESGVFGVVATLGVVAGYEVPAGVSLGFIFTTTDDSLCNGGSSGSWMSPAFPPFCKATGVIVQAEGSPIYGQVAVGFADLMGLGVPVMGDWSRHGISFLNFGYAAKLAVQHQWEEQATYVGPQADLHFGLRYTFGLMKKISAGALGNDWMPVFRIGIGG